MNGTNKEGNGNGSRKLEKALPDVIQAVVSNACTMNNYCRMCSETQKHDVIYLRNIEARDSAYSAADTLETNVINYDFDDKGELLGMAGMFLKACSRAQCNAGGKHARSIKEYVVKLAGDYDAIRKSKQSGSAHMQ